MKFHVPLALPLLLLVLPLLATAAPIDSRQYGFLQTGQSEAEVLRRYGPPDRVIEEEAYDTIVRTGPGVARAVPIRLYSWVYAGDSQTLTTVVRFRNGVVQSFHKGR